MVSNGALNPYIQGQGSQQTQLETSITFFESQERFPDLGSLGSLILAQQLVVTLATTTDAVASTVQRKSINNGAQTAQKAAVKSLTMTWPKYYKARRAGRMYFEEITEYRGPQQGLFGPRKKVGTGVFFVSVDHSDGMIKTFAGRKSNDPGSPNPFNGINLITLAFDSSEAKTKIVPNALENLARQLTITSSASLRLYSSSSTVLPSSGITTTEIESTVGTLPAAPQRPPIQFDPNTWYRLTNLGTPGYSLDVLNDGSGTPSGVLRMATTSDVSGQYWTIRRHDSSEAYYLSALYQGPASRLDVYGDDKMKPHLATSGNYSGQLWRVNKWADGTYKLTNDYSGEELRLEGRSGEVHLAEGEEPTQRWDITAIRPITESQFS